MAILFLQILFIAQLILFLFTALKKSKHALPPGPPSFSHLGNISWFVPSFSSLTPALRHLRSKYGPIVTLYAGSTPAIFISSGNLAYRTLVCKGQAFAFRPPPLGTFRSLSANHHTVNLASYNPQWQLLRHNISSFFTVASLSFSVALRRSLDMLIEQLNHEAASEGSVMPSESIQFALFQFFTNLCFGEILDTELLRELRAVQLGMLNLAVKLSVFNLLPKALMLVFLPRLWKLLSFRKRQKELIVPIITMHRRFRNQENKNRQYSYLDSLLALTSKENGRSLTDEEIINLCSEFINAATETTSTALEWIMANLVKHEGIQETLFDSMRQFTNMGDQHVEVEILKQIPYLKAVVLEGLRRHPPAHFLLPHTVNTDISLDGCVIPKDSVINYAVAEIGRDKTVWEEPLNFMPERFFKGKGMHAIEKDKIKMMPFGAGRRACPGEGIATLVLEYFVANLVRTFHWKRIENKEIDMTELPGLTVTMKYPLQTRLVSRTN
jgi:cytochrome P450 family 89 subfamily A